MLVAMAGPDDIEQERVRVETETNGAFNATEYGTSGRDG
jgi:hypothetical protein